MTVRVMWDLILEKCEFRLEYQKGRTRLTISKIKFNFQKNNKNIKIQK